MNFGSKLISFASNYTLNKCLATAIVFIFKFEKIINYFNIRRYNTIKQLAFSNNVGLCMMQLSFWHSKS